MRSVLNAASVMVSKQILIFQHFSWVSDGFRIHQVLWEHWLGYCAINIVFFSALDSMEMPLPATSLSKPNSYRDQVNRKPWLSFISAQLKISAAVQRDRKAQAFKTLYIYIYSYRSLTCKTIKKFQHLHPGEVLLDWKAWSHWEFTIHFSEMPRTRLLMLSKHGDRPLEEEGMQEHLKWNLREMNHVRPVQLQCRQKNGTPWSYPPSLPASPSAYYHLKATDWVENDTCWFWKMQKISK